MKIMTYNILDRAVATLPQIIEIVNKQSPDLIVLNEANTFAEKSNRVLNDFAQATHFPYFDIALSGEYDYHVAIFSKYPIKEVKKPQPLVRACIIALIDSPIGKLSVAGMHLSPVSEEAREKEIDMILDQVKEYPQSILLGDMNSLAANEYDNDIISGFNEIQIKKFTKDRKLCFNTVNRILSADYIDTAKKLDMNKESTVPTASNKDKAHSELRLDYIFLSQSIASRLKSYTVIKDQLTDMTSDHYPVIVELSNL